MRVGILARAELSRGLGIQTHEYARHLDPAKVLVVDVGRHETFPITPAAFPRATVVEMADDGTLPERAVRKWLRGLDVVLFAETPYDWRFCDWARDAEVRTVCHVNPEFYRHGRMPLPHPDGWWNPTTWRLDKLPPGTRHVPVPVALDRFEPRMESHTGRSPRFLHSVGKWALYDRNGTETFLRAAYLHRGRLDATVRTQDPLPPDVAPADAADWVTVTEGTSRDYWTAYDGFDVLVLPRRYGGLSLPVQEAMAAGLAVVMPNVSPNPECWPVVPVHARMSGRAPLPVGWVEIADTNPADLASTMAWLADDPAALANARAASRGWAEDHSWERMLPRYLDELAAVIADPAGPPPRDGGAGHDPFRPAALR